MIYYDSASVYIATATTNAEKLAKVEAIIAALEDTALKSASNDDLSEYSLDDGQTKIKTVYRSTADVLKSLRGFEQLRQMYINRLNGRVVRLFDEGSFRL